ncbi:hypothetical protein HYDPIDRAFT_33069 [Hydnomerulius pinastri MD-312]|uniref:Uncharacterized protein n=1 Tax=Hydnomerulius pinastri MD-312 TaxID=994086 RepID=A0A0C9W0Z3_9AGAM|nr:hypothetical protein HYDPIDRAFT_33069 [Hydnomerulius pinastri MD-312]
MKRMRDTAIHLVDSDTPDAKCQRLGGEVPHTSDVIPAPSMKQKRDMAIDIVDSDTPDAKHRHLKEEVPHASDVIPAPSMKWKRDTAIDIADSDTPDTKCQRLEEALNAHLGNATKSLFILLNELLYSVISFLGVKELRTCTKVLTLLRDIASPSFLAAVHFTPAQTPYWLSIDQKHCEALLVWSRMASFTSPKNLFFNVAQDIHLCVLNIFIQAPRAANIPAVYLSCHGDSICMVLAATVLESLQASGC